jgi:hypothetical protein
MSSTTRETDLVSATCFRDSNGDLWQTGEKMQDRIRIICPNGVIYIPLDSCFIELHLKNPIKCGGLVQSGHYHVIHCLLPE